MELGTEQRPLRVAIVGSGPSAFYAADALYKHPEVHVVVNMFEKLPAPYGLVRYGVAPDHGKIKNVIKIYDQIALEHPNFHFFGNVEIGKDLTLHQLRKFHDAVIFANGAETDRKLGIHGEGLKGSHTATEFVAWYNGHPEFRDRQFDLSSEVAVVIGQGNVAMDVARILLKTVDELKNTDISKHALEALAQSKIKEVHIIGRRGPVQAAYTPTMLREFGELADAYPVVDPKYLQLNPASQAETEGVENAQKKKNYDALKELALIQPDGRKRKLIVHYFKSPAAMYGDDSGKLNRIYLERNELMGEAGHQKSRATGEKETIYCGLVFRSIGYAGIPIEGLPFDSRAGIIPNDHGRVSDSETILTGLYTAGWIKRGPSGIIGTNKADSDETVRNLLEDIKFLIPGKNPTNEQLIELLNEQNVRYVTYSDWKKIDAAEIKNGEAVGKPREKFTTVDEMLNVLDPKVLS